MTRHQRIREIEDAIADWARGEGHCVENVSGEIVVTMNSDEGISNIFESAGEEFSATALAEAIERRIAEFKP